LGHKSTDKKPATPRVSRARVDNPQPMINTGLFSKLT